MWDKGKSLDLVLEKYSLKEEEICYIGDHLNDIPIFERVGLPIAFNPKDERLKEKVKYIIYDFRELWDLIK